MINNNKTNDWFASLLFNPDKTIPDFITGGLSKDNTALLAREFYKNKSRVQEAFSDDTGTFNNVAYNKFYDSVLRTYDDFINTLLESDFLDEYIYSPMNIDIDPSKKTKTPRFDVIAVKNPNLLTTGTVSMFGESVASTTPAERAQNRPVYDPSRGGYLDYKPNEASFFDRMKNSILGPTLVMATYDEDGTHKLEDGREVEHHKGDYKYDETGSEFYEVLGDRSPYGKQVLHVTDVLTVDGSAMNKYDFLDSDSKKKTVMGQTAKVIAAMAPLLIKGTRNPYVFLTGAIEFGSAISAIFKVADEWIEGGDASNRSTTWKTLNSFEGFARKVLGGTSQEGQNKMLGFENISNIISHVGLQLFQQQGVAGLAMKMPKWLSMSKKDMDATKRIMAKYDPEYVKKYGKTIALAIKDKTLAKEYEAIYDIGLTAIRYNRLRKLGQRGADLSKTYMAITQTGPLVETMEEVGFSTEAKVVGTIAALYGFQKIFNSSLGDNALRGFGFDDVTNGMRKFFKEQASAIEKEVGEKLGQTGLGQTARLGLGKKIGDRYVKLHDWLLDHPNEFINSSVKEALEEVSEEALQDAILISLSTIEDVFRREGENNYTFAGSNPMERYLMSALGGAIGGPMFTGIDKIQRGTFGVHKAMEKPVKEQMMEFIRDGKTLEVLDSVDKIVRSNKNGITNQLSTKIAEELSEDGKVYFLPSENIEDSQAYAVGEQIKNWVMAVDSHINNEGYALKNDEIIFKALAQDARLNALAKNARDLNILNDFKNNLSNLIDAKMAMASSEESSGSKSSNEKYNKAKENLDSLLSGERAAYFTKKLAFLMSRSVNSNFIDADIEMYVRARGLDYNNMSQETKDKFKKEYELMLAGDSELSDGSTNSYNWSEIAFNAYNSFDKVVGPSIAQFSDNYVFDMLTGTMVKDLNFTSFVKELQDVFNVKQEASLTDEEKTAIFDKYRGGKTNLEIIDIMNPNKLKLSAVEQKEVIDNYFMSNYRAAEDVKKAEVLKWLLKNIAISKLNPEAIKYGIDSITMLKTREELRSTMLKIEELRLKYGIDYIDSRTSDALIKMEEALNGVDFKEVFNRWVDLESFVPGVNNLLYLVTSGDILDFEFNFNNPSAAEEAEEEEEIEGAEGFANADVWRIKRTYDGNGVPVLNSDGTFDVVSETGAENTITRDTLKNMILNFYLEKVTSMLDLLKQGSIASANVTAAINANTKRGIGDYLLSSLYNDLSEEYTDRLNLIEQSTNLRKRILKNPVYSALDKISEQILGAGEKIFALIEREEKEIGKKSSLQEYVLSDLIKRDRLLKAFKLLQAVKNVINGKIQNTTDFDFNDTINHFLEHYGKKTPDQVAKENPTISEEIAAIVNRDIDVIGEKLLYLINLDIMNGASKFLDSARTHVRLNSLMIGALTGQLGVKFNFVNNAKINDEKFFDFSEIGITAEDKSKIANYIKTEASDDEAIEHTERILTKVKSYIYNKFNSPEIDDEVRKTLLIQMMDGLDMNSTEQRINQTLTEDTLNPYTAFSVLLSTLSSDPIKFRSLFVEEIGDLIPYSALLFNAEVMCAYADNNKWFSEATTEIKSNLEKYFRNGAKFAELFESFNNLLFTWGNAGAGKTVFLAKMAAKQYQRNNKDAKIKVVGPNKNRAVNLTAATGVEDNADRIELFKYILGADSEAFKKYELMMAFVNENKEKTSMEINGKMEEPYDYYARRPITIDYNGKPIVMAKSLRVLADDFITPEEIINKPDLAIIDEITKFDTFELQILDRAGIKVIGLGDRGLVSFRLFGKPHDPAGIYMNTAELSMSVRSTNIHKKDNDNKLGAIMNSLFDQFKGDYGSSLQKSFDKQVSMSSFTYNEVEEDGVYILNGEKIVENLNITGDRSVEGLIKGLKEGEQIVYIHNPGTSSSTYAEMDRLAKANPGKIDFKTLNDVQGNEYRYAIVDIDFTKITSNIDLYKNDELLDSLKEFKTAVSRSMDGTIIVDNKTVPFHKDFCEEQGYTSLIGDSKSQQAQDYAKKIIKIIVDTTPNIKVSNENSSKGLESTESSTEDIEEDNKEKDAVKASLFITENALCGTFYNHLSAAYDETTLKYETSGLSEDLGIFNITNKKDFNKVRTGLAFLKSYIISTKIAGNKYTVLDDDFSKTKNAINYKDFTEKLGFTSVAQLLNALKRGKFIIKLSDSTSKFSKSHGSIEKESDNSDNGVLGRIVFQISDSKGKAYDITVGAISSDYVAHLLEKGKLNGKDIAKPTGEQSIYFNFNRDIEWTVNTMKPLTKGEGFKVNEKLPLSKLVENHPEIIISKPILSKTGKHKGKSFAIYTYNMFEDSSTESLAALRNKEMPANFDGNKTTSVIYLDRVGYTVSDWMDQFGEWIKNPNKQSNLELFTGYMTSARFVISLIEYYNSMEAGPKKEKLFDFLSGRIESKLLTSTAVEISKTKENVQAITAWIEKNGNDPNVFKDWISKSGTSLFDEEKFVKSSQKIASIIKNKTAKSMFATLQSIKLQITKGSKDFGDMTVEVIDDFITQITNLHNDFKKSAITPVDDNSTATSLLVSQWLNDGILIRSTRMYGILYDIYSLWSRGEVGSEVNGTLFKYDSKEDFQNMFTDVINHSKFFLKDENGNGMIFIEGRKYTGATDKGIIGNSYYYDSNPISNFTVSSDIQTPSIYFKKINTVNLNATESPDEAMKPPTEVKEEPKEEPKKEPKKDEPKEEPKEPQKTTEEETNDLLNINETTKAELLALQPGNKLLEATINRLLPKGSVFTAEELKSKIGKMFNASTTVWESQFVLINGINHIIEKPTIAVKDGTLVIIPNRIKLSKKYNAKTNSKEFNLDTVEITKFNSPYLFEFKDNGILYLFNGNEDGTFADPVRLTQEVTTKEINDVLKTFKEDGKILDEEEAFDLVYDFLVSRYANVNQFNEDMSQPDLKEFFRNLILTSVDPNMDPMSLDFVVSQLYMKDFKNLKCK